MLARVILAFIALSFLMVLLGAQPPPVAGELTGVQAVQNLALDPYGRVVDVTFDRDLSLTAPWDRFRFDMDSVQPLAREGGAFLGDLTGDGVLDLVIASFMGERLFFPGTGDGPRKFGSGSYFQFKTTDPATDPFHDYGQDGNWLTGDIADLDGDGNKEIIIGMRLYANTGTAAQPQLDWRYTFPGSGTVRDPAPSIGDLNGDGKPDVVLTYTDATWVYWNNSKPGTFSFTRQLVYEWPSGTAANNHVALGDLNRDGLLDLASPAGIYFNNGTARVPDFDFTAASEWNKSGGPNWDPAGDRPPHVFLKDGDGDGLIDAYVSNLSSTAWQVLYYKNVGTANAHKLEYSGPVLAASSPLNLAERGKTKPDLDPGWPFLARGDIDQNGKPDILLGMGTRSSLEAPTILWNMPVEGSMSSQALTFQDLYTWPDSARVNYDCGGSDDPLCRPPNLLSAWTDLTGDGLPDALRTDQWMESFKLYVRARSGTMPFALGADNMLLTGPSNTQAVARGVVVMDLDRDGNPDLVTGTQTGALLYYRNKGTPGAFADAVPLSDPEGNPIDVGDHSWPTAIDLDGDGNLDLLVITGDGKIHKILCVSPGSAQGYRTSGLLGTPEQNPIDITHSTGYDQSLATLDVDGDGLQDVVMGDSDGRVWLLKNVGTAETASFSLRPLTISRTAAAYLEIISPSSVRLYFGLPTFAGQTSIGYHNLPTTGLPLSGELTIAALHAPTATPSATNTATRTPTSTYTPSQTPAATSTWTNTATPTATSTSTSTPTRTPTKTLTPTITHTPTKTSTPTKTFKPTKTSTRTKTPTRTATPKLVIIENEDYRIQFDGWLGIKDARANGGSYRLSSTLNDDLAFQFTGTFLKWITRKGPDMGKALVTIDGARSHTVDLYSANVIWKAQVSFTGLGSGKHTLVIQVLGDKYPASSNTFVAVDAFSVGTTTTQDNSRLIQYCDWKNVTTTGPSGGAYRSNEFAGSIAKLTFIGTGIDWITAKGPKFGQAEVFIDGVKQGMTVDLYNPKPLWKVAITFPSLSPGQHTIEIRPLGAKNTASTGNGVVLDAFKGRITVVASPRAQGLGADADARGKDGWWLWLFPFGALTLWLVHRIG